jgi:hypothetical protein
VNNVVDRKGFLVVDGQIGQSKVDRFGPSKRLKTMTYDERRGPFLTVV